VVLWAGTLGLSGKTRVTRPGYTMHRYSYGPIDGSGILRVVVSNDVATMPIPTGTRATLTLLEDSGQSYAFSASLEFIRKLGVDTANGSQQFAEYGWSVNAASASGVTVT